MQIYKVGGCVRDYLMCVTPKDIDYVVVGSTPEEMLSLGFSIVGNHFPVFLHPETGEEYALARKEKKVGDGYNGFVFETDGVTLETDQSRRDLTINSIAMDDRNGIFDPFNGVSDIQKKILRHVNADAFKEDPVRVLRIARFLARWTDFSVASETFKLCKEMVDNGDLNHITGERVVNEMVKALNEKRPSRFFTFLAMIGALKVVFPEIDALRGVPQPYIHHPEGDCFIHTMMVLDQASDTHGTDDILKFAALCHDLGKATTKPEILPSHHGHESRGYYIVKEMCERLPISNEYRDIAMLVAKFHTHIHNFDKLKPSTIVDMYKELNTRKNNNIGWYLPTVSMCDARGRTSFFENIKYPNAYIATAIFDGLDKIKLSNFFAPEEIKQMSVDKIKNFLHKEMINEVNRVKEIFKYA